MPLQGVIFCTDQLDVTGKEKPGMYSSLVMSLSLTHSEDLIDFRIDVNILSSLRAQKDNAKIWKELGGSGNIDIVHTVREAVLLVREKYKGAEILVTGSSFLASGLIHVL